MARFDNFADLAEHYANLTSADAFAGAFTSEIAASQLSIHDEPTADDLPDADAARAVAAHVTGEIFNLFADTRLAPVAPRIAWGIVNSFHKVAQQLARQEDDAARELGELARIMDPSEIHAVKVEETQRLCQSLHEAVAAIGAMRDHAAEIYRVECGQPWSATTGSRTGRTLTASQIDARDYLAARAAEKREAHAPTGPVVVLSGGQDWTEHKALWDRLDAIKARIPAMTLVTTAQHKGADAIGAAWAAARGVPLVAFRLNRQLGNRAAFERNRSIQRLLPVEAVICEGSGVQINLAQNLRAAGVPLTIFKHADFAIRDQAHA
ncbi:MAG: SLOG family protein [Allorhizobium sp.]|uniref:SLOG family protein n=1 Tax=Allorhizobium sp. TaxID=633478 RepID=UPI004034BB19